MHTSVTLATTESAIGWRSMSAANHVLASAGSCVHWNEMEVSGIRPNVPASTTSGTSFCQPTSVTDVGRSVSPCQRVDPRPAQTKEET